MSFETLLFDVENHVARLTLNRPDAGNAMDAVMMKINTAITDIFLSPVSFIIPQMLF